MKFSNLVCFIAIKHSLRIITSYLCREGGEYNTRKGNNPGWLLTVYEPLGDPTRSIQTS
nr:MAG TPA: hypothetical protein [Bacteriophage sp.]